jgi:hypothetical protein
MDKQTTRTSNTYPETAGTTRPQWWTDKHTSTWDRVKAALRRDWEQTKADFSSDRPDLNQEIGDTVKQSVGKQPIPPLSVKTRPDDPMDMAKRVADQIQDRGKAQQEVVKAQTEAAAVQVKTQGKIASEQQAAQEKIAELRNDASQKIAEVQQKASEKVAEAEKKVAEKGAAVRDWNQVEPAVRYGYGARSQYADSPVWDDQLETRLRNEWTQLKNGTSWDDARSHVRHGWESAGRNSIV